MKTFTMTKKKVKQPFHFTDLPAELRFLVYKLYFPIGHKKLIRGRHKQNRAQIALYRRRDADPLATWWKPAPRDALAILYTNRAMHDDALPVLYTYTTFVFERAQDVCAFSQVSHPGWRHVHRIDISSVQRGALDYALIALRGVRALTHLDVGSADARVFEALAEFVEKAGSLRDQVRLIEAMHFSRPKTHLVFRATDRIQAILKQTPEPLLLK